MKTWIDGNFSLKMETILKNENSRTEMYNTRHGLIQTGQNRTKDQWTWRQSIEIIPTETLREGSFFFFLKETEYLRLVEQ